MEQGSTSCHPGRLAVLGVGKIALLFCFRGRRQGRQPLNNVHVKLKICHAMLWDLLLHLHTCVMLRCATYVLLHLPTYVMLGCAIYLLLHLHTYVKLRCAIHLLLHLHTYVTLRWEFLSCTCAHTSCYAGKSSLALTHKWMETTAGKITWLLHKTISSLVNAVRMFVMFHMIRMWSSQRFMAPEVNFWKPVLYIAREANQCFPSNTC